MRTNGRLGAVSCVLVVMWLGVCGCGAESVAPDVPVGRFLSIESSGCPGQARRVEDCILAVDLDSIPLGLAILQHLVFEGADNLYVRLRWSGECQRPLVDGKCQIDGILGPYERSGSAENVVIGMGLVGEYEVGYTLLQSGRSVADTMLYMRVVE